MRSSALGVGLAAVLGTGSAYGQGFPIGGVGGECPDFTASCPMNYEPVICSDGMVYPNLCHATTWGCVEDCEPYDWFPLLTADQEPSWFGGRSHDAGPVDGGEWMSDGASTFGGCPPFVAACPMNYEPVECSDGNIYPNRCHANSWGCTDDCWPVNDWFQQGPGDAGLASSFVEATIDVGDDPGMSQPLIWPGGGGDCPRFPVSCPMIYAPVICSDGQVYTNQCFADAECAEDCEPYDWLGW